MAQADLTGVRLFAVAGIDAGHQATLAPGTTLIPFRDLGAVVRPAPYVAAPPTPADLEAHRAVVECVFAQRSVVPAPPGTVFRSRDALAGWLELHYFTLVEALGFVDERAVARVRVEIADGFQERRGAPAGAEGAGAQAGTTAADLENAAAEVFRSLRRGAVALITLRGEEGGRDTVPSACASFLVDRARWAAFTLLVSQEAPHYPALRLACTGPWPPYDFVRMHFGR